MAGKGSCLDVGGTEFEFAHKLIFGLAGKYRDLFWNGPHKLHVISRKITAASTLGNKAIDRDISARLWADYGGTKNVGCSFICM
jgi:hypothetical protein